MSIIVEQTKGLEMTDLRPYNVLFLCVANSARSIMAEAIINRIGAGIFRGFSAGRNPSGTVEPMALNLLSRLNFDVSGLRSKSWEEFAAKGALALDFVFTVCDVTAKEECPSWPGQPLSAHWPVPDPVKATGDDAQRVLGWRHTSIPIARLNYAFGLLGLDRVDEALAEMQEAYDLEMSRIGCGMKRRPAVVSDIDGGDVAAAGIIGRRLV